MYNAYNIPDLISNNSFIFGIGSVNKLKKPIYNSKGIKYFLTNILKLVIIYKKSPHIRKKGYILLFYLYMQKTRLFWRVMIKPDIIGFMVNNAVYLFIIKRTDR